MMDRGILAMGPRRLGAAGAVLKGSASVGFSRRRCILTGRLTWLLAAHPARRGYQPPM